MTNKLTIAALAIALLGSSALAQPSEIPGCKNPELMASDNGKAKILNKDVAWTKPDTLTRTKDKGYVLPNGDTIQPEPPQGYTVTIKFAKDCPDRWHWDVIPPKKFSGN